MEERIVEILMNKTEPTNAILKFFELDNEKVLLELIIHGNQGSYINENFFFALLDLRKDLERENMQIMCNGAAKNVYPSSMQLSMELGRTAYRLYTGQQARTKDMVDIFDSDKSLDFVTIDEQWQFYNEWLKGVKG